MMQATQVSSRFFLFYFRLSIHAHVFLPILFCNNIKCWDHFFQIYMLIEQWFSFLSKMSEICRIWSIEPSLLPWLMRNMVWDVTGSGHRCINRLIFLLVTNDGCSLLVDSVNGVCIVYKLQRHLIFPNYFLWFVSQGIHSVYVSLLFSPVPYQRLLESTSTIPDCSAIQQLDEWMYCNAELWIRILLFRGGLTVFKETAFEGVLVFWEAMKKCSISD